MFSRLALLLAVVTVHGASATLRLTAPKSQGMTRLLENDDVDYSWMNGYTLMYENCFPSEGMATFRLCPADSSCHADCSGAGEYVADFAFFVDAFTEAQLGAREYRCEMARENCDYDDDSLCYSASNLDYCQEEEGEFNLQEWLQCAQFDENYYIGPYCSSDNYNVYLGLFTDDACTATADVSFSETYGYVLEYSEESGSSIIADECASCKEHGLEEDQEEGDQEDEDELIEQCEELYEAANKCETNLGTDDADESGCSYIQEIQSNDSVTKGQPTSTSNGSSRVKKFWRTLFFLLVALIALYSCFWFSNKRRRSGNASAQEALVSN